MKKPTWKEVDKLAQKLLNVWLPTGRETHAWARAGAWDRDNWRRLARYVLVNYTPIPPTVGNIMAAVDHAAIAKILFKASQRPNPFLSGKRSTAMQEEYGRFYGGKQRKPKSCRLVRGKVVCS